MKKIFLLSASCLIVVSSAACDVCGCALGGNYYGLLPLNNKNFVGLRWSQAKFYAHMNHHSEYLPEEYSFDTYHKAELWGRFNLTDRLQVFAFVPYNYNRMEGNLQETRTSGLGDITLIANYRLLETTDDSEPFKHLLMLGGGVKLPTGKNDHMDGGVPINPNFQLGSGSIDFLMSAVYTLRYEKIGLNIETGYKINTRNDDAYRFGNQFNLASHFFYSKSVGAVSFLPNAGLYYESAARHRDRRSIVTNTGGTALFASGGMETYVANFSIGVNYKYPLQQQYNSDDIADIESKDRWTITVAYVF